MFLLIPGPLDAVPFSGGDGEEFGELVTVTRKGRDSFIPGWNQDPIAQVEAPADIEDTVHSFAFIQYVGHANDALGVTGEA